MRFLKDCFENKEAIHVHVLAGIQFNTVPVVLRQYLQTLSASRQ